MDLSIQCEYEDRPAEVRIRFAEVHGREVYGTIRIAVPGHSLDLSVPCIFLGCDIVRWVDDLLTVQAALQGNARLCNSGETIDLLFAVINRGRGRIVLGGRVELPSWTEIQDLGLFPTNFTPAGVLIHFAGFQLDQSYLPEMINTIRSFLNERSPDMSSPWDTK